MARTDKRTSIDNLASQAESAARKGDQGSVYRITRLVCGKYKGNNEVPIKNKDGQLLTSEKEQESRWAEHFKEILNRPPPTTIPTILDSETDLNINTDPPRDHEITKAIKLLKNGKAPGQDNLSAEMFKTDPELAAKILKPLFEKIWNNKEVPSDWTKGTIVKIPKKGPLNDCNNWRGITLLSIPSKIMARIILQRITNAIDMKIRKEQPGFRKGRGCADQIFALRNIIEQCTEWQRQLYINFVDFQKAFDSIHRDSLWRILRAYGIPQDIVLLIKSFYRNFTCKVGNSNIMFEVKTGVRQGCVMSALLFNLVIDWIMRRTTEDEQRGIRWTLFSSLEDLDFADDLALLAHTHRHIQDKTTRLNTFSQQVGLNISKTKTEVMTLNVNNPKAVNLNGTEPPITDIFTYLGSTITTTGGTSVDIYRRINKARNIFRMLNNVWRSTDYSAKTKLKLYQSCVLSTLLYGSECWSMTEKDLNSLCVFHNKNLRRIMRIFWPLTVTNAELYKQTGQESMEVILLRKRWRWIGHVLRRDRNTIVKTALHWTPEGKRKRGRPRNTWRRTVEAELEKMNHSWGTIERKAQDRQAWESFVAALHAKLV